MFASKLVKRVMTALGVLVLMGATDDNGCSSGSGYKYSCECWTSSSGGFTIGTPAPCGSDDADALSQAVQECTEEVGEECECQCSTGGGSCK